MGSKSRKLLVWLISLGAVLAFFLLYSRISKTPRIDTGTDTEFTATVSDFNSDIGKLGKVGIGTVQLAEYITRNEKTRQIEQIFGFEKLLDQENDQWQLQKPYIDFFQPDFTCHVTARTGTVRVETGPRGPTAKGGTFAGNVLINIVPRNSNDTKEGRIYLNDIAFVGEKSHFATPGTVKFVSENAQMLGRGLHGAYNIKLNRLEFLRIFHLESLRHKTSKPALFGSAKTETASEAYAAARDQTARPDKPVATDDTQKPKLSLTPTTQEARLMQGQYYKCVFSKNVVVDSPELFVFAEDQLSINNILWAKAQDDDSGKAGINRTRNAKATKVTKEATTSARKEPDSIHADAVRPQRRPLTEPNLPQKATQQPVDTVVTCNDGILVTPVDSNKSLDDFPKLETKDGPVNKQVSTALEHTTGRTTLIARKVDYCASSDETLVGGPLELTFDINDTFRDEPNKARLPVKVTAKRKAKFLPDSNQVIFEGDTVCTMLRQDPNGQHTYTLSSPTLTVDLYKEERRQSSGSVFDVRHLTATGGVVRLATLRTSEEKLLAGVELKCRHFDFDEDKQMFLATGPGVIKIYNSKVSDPNSDADTSSLKKTCWTIIENFGTLKFFTKTNQLVAQAHRQQLLNINYFPIIDGQVRYDQQVVAAARRIEALLYETADNEFELLTLTATGGIHYEERDIEFEGSNLFYDGTKHIMTIHGDQSWPCLYNGVPVDGIEYDLRNRKVKTQIVGPGALQIKQ